MAKYLKSLALLALIICVTNSVSAQKRIRQYEPICVFEEAKSAFENENYAAATVLFGQYLQLVGDSDSELCTEAKYYEAVGSALAEGNQEKIAEFVKQNPTYAFARNAKFLYANMLLKNNKLRDAVEAYESIDEGSLPVSDVAEFNFKKGMAYYLTYDVEKATPLFFKSALMPGKYQNDARYYYAHIQYVNDNSDAAMKYFRLIEDSPKYKKAVSLYMLQMNFAKGDYSSVTANADELISKAKSDQKDQLALMAAEAWYQQKNFIKALKYYKIATAKSENTLSREVEFRIGYCKMKTFDYQGATPHFQNVSAKSDDKLKQIASYYLAKCYVENKQQAEARDAFLAASKLDFDQDIKIDAMFNYAKLSLSKDAGKPDDAIAQLTDYLDNNPNSERADEARQLIVNLLLNSKEYEKAMRAVERFPEMNSELEETYAKLMYNVGIQSLENGDFDGAIKNLAKVANNGNVSASLSASATYWLFDAYFHKNDFANAEKYLMSFITMPDAEQLEMFNYTNYDYGYIFIQKGDIKNAAKEFSYFVKRNLSDKEFGADAMMRLGDCHFMSRNYSKAIVTYETATTMSENDADYALFQTAMAHGANGNIDAKVNKLNTLCEKYPESKLYERAKNEIEKANQGTGDGSRFRPQIKRSERLTKTAEYANFNIQHFTPSTMDFDYEYSVEMEKMSAMRFTTSTKSDNRDNYLKVALGTRLSPVLSFQHHSEFSKTMNLNIGVDHYSSWINQKDYKRSTFMNNGVNALFSNKFKSGQLDVFGAYHYDMYHLRSYDDAQGNAVTNKNGRNIHSAKIGAKWTSVGTSYRELYQEYSGDYRYTGIVGGTNEHQANLNAHFAYSDSWIGEKNATNLQTINVDVNLNYDYLYKSLFMIALKPNFCMKGDSYDARIGLGLDFKTDDKFGLYPDLRFSYFLLNKDLEIYAKIGGQAKINTFESVVKENPFVTTKFDYLSDFGYEKTNVDLRIGGKMNIINAIDAHLRFGYKNVMNGLFYIPDFDFYAQYDKDETMYHLQAFDVVFMNYSVWNLNLEANWKINEDANAGISMTYNGYSIEHPWYKPAFEMTLDGDYRFDKNWKFNGSILLMGKRWAMNENAEAIQLKTACDIQLGADYQFSKDFKAFAEIHNLIHNKYQLYYNYPSMGFELFLGIKYSF